MNCRCLELEGWGRLAVLQVVRGSAIVVWFGFVVLFGVFCCLVVLLSHVVPLLILGLEA